MISESALLLFIIGLMVGAFAGWFGGMTYVLKRLDDAMELRNEMKEQK